MHLTDQNWALSVGVFLPLAGVLVDRWPIKKVMILSDLLRGLIAASLVLGQSVPQIAASMAALGLVSSFFAPAQAVAIRTLIAQEDLLSANAYLSSAFYVMRIVAPHSKIHARSLRYSNP